MTDLGYDEGGELGRVIDEFRASYLICQHCQEAMIETDLPKGYPHDGGLENKDGVRFWLYFLCKGCEYQWSWQKLERRIKNGVY